MAEVVLLDTGPLVALLDRSDAAHQWVVGQLHKLRAPLWTCGAVMAEAMFLLRAHPVAAERLHQQVIDGFIEPAAENPGHWARALELMRRYSNVPMSFADAYLVVLAEIHEQPRVFTIDKDFLIYRMHDRQEIPLLSPFTD
jgi:predicted nucleic acid-binding protein